MKTIRCISLVGLTLMFVFSSCRMEKRVYRSGYHTEWMAAKHKGHNGNDKNVSLHTPSQKESSEKLNQTTIVTDEQIAIEPDLIDVNTTNADNGIDIVASVDNKKIILPGQTKNDWLSKTAKTKDKEQKQTFKSEFKKVTKMIMPDSDDEPEMSGMALAGFICGTVGFLLSIIIGFPFLLGTLGTIFSAIGLGQTSKKGKKGKGFALAGLITAILAIIIFWIWLAVIGIALYYI